MWKVMCVCLRDYIVTKILTAVNIHACYIWIVNDITDSNTGFLFQFLFYFLYSVLE